VLGSHCAIQPVGSCVVDAKGYEVEGSNGGWEDDGWDEVDGVVAGLWEGGSGGAAPPEMNFATYLLSMKPMITKMA
jgi:hypothetical protein